MEWVGMGVEAFTDLIQFLTKTSRTNNIHKKLLLREIRNNLLLLRHIHSKEADLWGIITELRTDALENAFQAGFRFNALKRGKLKQDVIAVLEQRRGQKYLGWTAERLLMSIEGKILELKRIPRIYRNPHQSTLNIPLRLSNLAYQLQLLTVFLKSG